MQTFSLTEKQIEARRLIAAYQYFMIFGGSRSGKTFLLVYIVIVRALKADKSRHAILRFRFNAIKASIIFDTLPKVMSLCFPQVQYTINKTDWFLTFANESQIWFGGLDDKERTEKILGQEYATIYLNECSQIPWGSVGIVVTRLAQNCMQNDGVPLKLRMLFDCNPPDKNHWTYRKFIQKVCPDNRTPLLDADLHGSIQINPNHNIKNLPSSYIDTLKSLPAHLRKRFLDGAFKDANPNALFSELAIDRWRTNADELPDMQRIVVAVDPSGADDDSQGNDAIGIYVVGLGVDGIAYLIEDATVTAGPAVWGRAAVNMYHKHKADLIVGEQNFGGAMVKFVIQTADRHVKYKMVTASRGKVVRAEPFSPLFEDGRIRMVGSQSDLEDELSGFSTNGFTGTKSPNRADAAIWGLSELFPAVVGKRERQKTVNALPTVNKW